MTRGGVAGNVCVVLVDDEDPRVDARRRVGMISATKPPFYVRISNKGVMREIKIDCFNSCFSFFV